MNWDPEIDRLLQAYREMSEEQQNVLHEVWHKSRGGILFTVKSPDWRSALTNLIKAAHASNRMPVLRKVQDEIHKISRGPALFPTIDAASALVVKDLIKGKEFNTLYKPWKTVMGR